MDVVEIGKSIYKNEDLFPPNYFQTNDNIGTKSSDFEIIKLLGKGAFGKVYKVKSKINFQIYAMKIFDKHLDTISENLKKKLLHPNIINIYGHFQENGKIYVIMEYMDNGNLKDYISVNKGNNVLSENQILCILLQATWPLYDLNHYNDEKIILRNIKPENILIDRNLKIKFGEFYSTMKLYEDEKEEEKHPYEIEQDNELIKAIWNRTKKYMSESLKGPKADIYSLGKVLEDLLIYDSTNSKVTGIIYKMCEENDNKNQIDILFKNITELYIEHQKNSSIESVVLGLKSFQNWSELLENEWKNIENEEKNFKKNEEKNSENKVLKTFIDILTFIKNPKSNFYSWNYHINKLRLNINQEINNIDEIEEIDPREAYLYLINIIINETKKYFFKKGENNICEYSLLNFEKNDKEFELNSNIDKSEIDKYKYFIKNNFAFDIDIIKQISGLIRIQTVCKICNFTKYQFNNYLLLEIDPEESLKKLKTESKDQKVDLEKLLIFDKESYSSCIQCSQCFENTEHDCTKELYSLPDCLVISIKEKLYENYNAINIKKKIILGKEQTIEKKDKKYELVALIKINRKQNDTLVYSFSKFNNNWFLSQRYKGIEKIEMNDWHLRPKNIRMLFYQAIPEQ